MKENPFIYYFTLNTTSLIFFFLKYKEILLIEIGIAKYTVYTLSVSFPLLPLPFFFFWVKTEHNVQFQTGIKINKQSSQELEAGNMKRNPSKRAKFVEATNQQILSMQKG